MQVTYTGAPSLIAGAVDIIKYYQERKLQHMLFTFYVQYGPAEEETEREVQPTVDVKPSLLQRFDHCIGGDKYATTFPEQARRQCCTADVATT